MKSDLPFTADGWVEAVTVRTQAAPPEAVWAEVIAAMGYLTPDEKAKAVEMAHWIMAPGPNRNGFHIAGGLRVVAIQGGWWYRGVTAVEADGDGSRVTHVVVNVAPGLGRWLAHWFQARAARKGMG